MSERPKIRVVFIDQVGRTPGGAERTLATFCRFLPPDISATAILFEDGSFADELRALNIEVEILAMPASVAAATREHSAFDAFVAVPRIVWRLSRILRRIRPQLVYTNSMKAHLLGSVAAKLTNTRCVIHFHDLFTGSALTLLRLLARFGSHARIACSRLVASTMDAGPTEVIYGPVEIASYSHLEAREIARGRLGLRNDRPVVALIGRINRWKGHDRFVRIAAMVNDVIPAQFAIIGAPVFRDADFIPELEALIVRLNVKEHVSFHGWVDDVRTVFAAIDVNVNCSTREPFGRTMVEAAAAGVPTICFSDSGASETIVDGMGARAIEPGNEAAFAAAIVEMLANHKRFPGHGDAARRSAERFDAPRIAEEMADVIRRATVGV